MQVTRDLWTAVRSDPALEAVPVYALTLSNGVPGVLAGATELGDLILYVTYGNAHVYACCSNNVWQNHMPLVADIQASCSTQTDGGYRNRISDNSRQCR